MGAWIEIKPQAYDLQKENVAPGMGAWIEISHPMRYPTVVLSVAPGMGAWIEILFLSSSYLHVPCRSRYGSVD